MVLIVHPEGFEPSTPRAEIWYSIQLNYGRLKLTIILHPRLLVFPACRQAGIQLNYGRALFCEQI